MVVLVVLIAYTWNFLFFQILEWWDYFHSKIYSNAIFWYNFILQNNLTVNNYYLRRFNFLNKVLFASNTHGMYLFFFNIIFLVTSTNHAKMRACNSWSFSLTFFYFIQLFALCISRFVFHPILYSIFGLSANVFVKSVVVNV